MIRLRVVTLDKTVFDADVDSVILPGEEGEFGVLHGHVPLITPLKLGEISAKNSKEDFFLTISSGMAEIQPNRVLVLADQSERAEEIDERLAEEARIRAEKIMKEKHVSAESFALAEAELQKALLQIKIAKRHKSKRNIISPGPN